METKENFLSIVKDKIKRKGIEDLIKFLEESDFFTAPASTRFHGVNSGDLAKHSLLVYDLLMLKKKQFELEYTDETVAIAALFHDLCKVNFYKEKPTEPATEPQLRYLKTLSGGVAFANLTKDIASKLIEQYKNSGATKVEVVDGPSWIVDDQLPLGHGEKSLFIVGKYIDLIDDEAMAIRWHMGGFDPGVQFNYPSGFAFRQAADICKLITILHTSDLEADKIFKI